MKTKESDESSFLNKNLEPIHFIYSRSVDQRSVTRINKRVPTSCKELSEGEDDVGGDFFFLFVPPSVVLTFFPFIF